MTTRMQGVNIKSKENDWRVMDDNRRVPRRHT
jgi:predicted component of type VI protein secretion system